MKLWTGLDPKLVTPASQVTSVISNCFRDDTSELARRVMTEGSFSTLGGRGV